MLSTEPTRNARIFDTLAWATCLPEWGGPAPGERPTACIVLLLGTRITQTADVDVGIVCQTMLLGAVGRVDKIPP